MVSLSPSRHFFWCCLFTAFVGLAHLAVWVGRAKYASDAYMDEIFHVPQTQRFCRGDFKTWDPKITTFPGLYLAAAIPQWLLSSSAFVSKSVGNTKPAVAALDLCSTLSLRLINGVFFGSLCAWLSFSILWEMHILQAAKEGGKAKAKANVSVAQIAFNALAINLFPVYFFSVDLYYTDVGSMSMVLLSFLMCLKGRHHCSSAASWAAVLFRQTNIIWAAFVMAYDVFLQLNPTHVKKRKDDEAFLKALWENLQKAFTHRKRLLRNHFAMILLFASFVAFVYKNKGIVVGDPEAHRPKLHLVQFLYCTLVICGAYFLAHYRPMRLNEVFVKPFLAANLTRKCRMLCSTFVVILVLAFVIQRYTLVHPYTLADNRHYTFYVWRKLLGRSETFRLLLAIPYFTSLRLLFHSLSATQSQLVVFAYFVCTLSTVVFAELLEFRYFIIPFAMYGLLSRPMTIPEAFGTCVAFAALNMSVEFLFLFRPFTWPDGSTARFMW